MTVQSGKKEVVVSANVKENLFVLKIANAIIAEGPIPAEPELIEMMEGKKILEFKKRAPYLHFELTKESSREIAALLMMERMAG